MDRRGGSCDGVGDHRGLATSTCGRAWRADTTSVWTTISRRLTTGGFRMDDNIGKRVGVGARVGVPPIVLRCSNSRLG